MTDGSASVSGIGPAGSLTCMAELCLPLSRMEDPNDRSSTSIITYTNRQPAWSCCFSPDGRTLAVAYGAPDPCVRIYHHHHNGKNPPRPHQQPAPSTTAAAAAAASPSSSTSTAASLHWNNWQLHATLRGAQTRTIRCVAFAPISSPLVLAAASFDGTIAIWEQQQQTNSKNNNVVKEEEPQQQSSKNRSETIGDGDGSHLWECSVQLEGHDNEVKCVVWNATGSLLATCGRDKTVWVWECFLPGTVGGTAVVNAVVNGSAYNPIVPETTSASGGVHYDTGGADWDCLAVLNGHTADVKFVQFAASHGQWGDGDEIVLSASYDETIRIWAEDAGDWYCAACIQAVHAETIWSLTVAPSGTRFISGSADGSLAIYKCYSKQEMKARLANTNPESVKDNGNPVQATWLCVGKLEGAHNGVVYSVDYASARASHGRIVSGGADNRIQIYREALTTGSSETATEHSTLPPSDKPFFLLDAAVTTVEGGDVNCVCWHPSDGSVVASASDDGTVRLWNYRYRE